jgi:L-ribulose-5-phosphate 3-epimerase
VKSSIGIMQGRLSAASSAGPQVFPAATWRSEFVAARELGFDTIEWLLEARSFADNPLLSPTGRAEIMETAQASGVRVSSVCAHCVLEWRPFAPGGVQRLEDMGTLLSAAGLERVIVPILEEATIAKALSRVHAAEIFLPVARAAEQAGVDLAFEMDRPAGECLEFIALLDSPRARLCYDTGNATALGYDIVEEINLLLPLVAEIHLKDRRVGGASQPLGHGDTRFAEFFKIITERAWAGPFVLETPTGGDPLGQARKNLAMVKEYLS